MSDDRGLKHELAYDSQAERTRATALETERQSALIRLKQEQKIIGSTKVSDLLRHYQERDNAFFMLLDTTQRMQSKITLLSDYQDSVAIPKIKHGDAKIQSALQRRNPAEDAYLLDFIEFIKDQMAHDKEILRLNRWILDIHQQIRLIVIPRFLYALLIWAPTLFNLYQYIFGTNDLDNALKQGESLQAELANIEEDLHAEDNRYYKRWSDKYAEYHALSMQPAKVTLMLQQYEIFENIRQSERTLTEFIQTSNNNDLKNAYKTFLSQPSYIHLFHLCTRLCEQRFKLELEHQDVTVCTQALSTLRILYSEADRALDKFTQQTLQHLSEKAVFAMLTERLESSITVSKEIQDKIKRASTEFETLTIRVARLNRTDNAAEIESIRNRLQKLDTYIEKGKKTLASRRNYITPLKHFLQNRTGENLRALYWVALESSDNTHEILERLYPVSIGILKAEDQETMMTISTEAALALQDQYYNKLITLLRSRDPQSQALKEVAEAFISLLEKENWTWAQFKTVERVVRKNPQYAQNKMLAALFNQIVTSAAGHQPEKMATRRTAASTPAQTSEVVLHGGAPTFFHAPTRYASPLDALIQELMGNIHLYNFRSSDTVNTNDEKQSAIQEVGLQLLTYIRLLSGDAHQHDISEEHIYLLNQIGEFILNIQDQNKQSRINTSDLELIHTQVAKLDPKHPIRKGVEFLISVFQTTDEYMHISTRYAQAELKKLLDEDLRLDNKLAEMRAKREQTATQINLNKLSIVSSILERISKYAARLDRYTELPQTEEHRLVSQLHTIANNLHQKLYQQRPKQITDIAAMMEQLESAYESLADYPVIYSAAKRLIDTIKETNEYNDTLAALQKPGVQSKHK